MRLRIQHPSIPRHPNNTKPRTVVPKRITPIAIMAPSFDHLPDPEEEEYDEEELDFSDLKEKYEVQMQQGLDTFVVVDGLPKVPEANKPKLIKFLLRRLNTAGSTTEDKIHMPIGESGETDGYATIHLCGHKYCTG